jgi:hypothetical protein
VSREGDAEPTLVGTEGVACTALADTVESNQMKSFSHPCKLSAVYIELPVSSGHLEIASVQARTCLRYGQSTPMYDGGHFVFSTKDRIDSKPKCRK